jgi:hypothetical protein
LRLEKQNDVNKCCFSFEPHTVNQVIEASVVYLVNETKQTSDVFRMHLNLQYSAHTHTHTHTHGVLNNVNISLYLLHLSLVNKCHNCYKYKIFIFYT